MKIRTIVIAQTLLGVMSDENITDSINNILEEADITSENLIDIKINTHPVYNITVSENTYINCEDKYGKLENNADFTASRYIVTIIYKTEE